MSERAAAALTENRAVGRDSVRGGSEDVGNNRKAVIFKSFHNLDFEYISDKSGGNEEYVPVEFTYSETV